MGHIGIDGAREALRGMMTRPAELPAPGDEAEAIDRMSLLESVKAACAAGQASDTLRLQELRPAAEAERGVPVERRCRGLSAEVALARRASGNAGGRYLGFARAMGETATAFARLREGSLSEWRATTPQHADGPVGDGDRNHARIMADTLVERLTGTTRAEDVAVSVDVVVSAGVLVGGAHAAADVPGYGPVPAGWEVTTAIGDDGTHEALIRTPTGHEHRSRAPACGSVPAA